MIGSVDYSTNARLGVRETNFTDNLKYRACRVIMKSEILIQ